MKRIFVVAIAALAFTACDNKNSESTTTSTDTSSSMMSSDTSSMNTMGSDTSTTGATGGSASTMSGNTTTTNSYVPAEGDVMYRDRKLMVWRNNAYVEADRDITGDNGVTIRRNGQVSRNGNTVTLEEGQTYSRTGRFFNSAGEAIDDGWDATKKGVNKAGQAIKKGANKVGEEVKDAVN